MTETVTIEATAAHHAMLNDIDKGNVYDVAMTHGEIPCVRVDGELRTVRQLVWDLEHLGLVWRPADDPTWRLTDEGRAARDAGVP